MLNRTMKSALYAFVFAGLAGCSSVFNDEHHAFSAEEAHPIAVDSQVVTLTIDADATTSDLSNIDKARLRAFAEAYLRSGHGPLSISSPSGGAEDFDGQEATADIRAALFGAGVAYSQIQGASYRTSADSHGKIILSYTNYVATPSPCGVWTGLRENDYRNLPMPNFGCATQNNLAALVADPYDLIAPTDETYPDAQARIRAVRAFREGGAPVSETDSAIEAQISKSK